MCFSTVFTGTKNETMDKITKKWKSGIIEEPNKIWVGEAHQSTKNKFECMETCAADKNCRSVTFNGPTSVNPNICVLAYRRPYE